MTGAGTDVTPIFLIIFGASGDLTHRKLVPALFRQHRKGRLPAELRVIGCSRSELSDEAFREGLRRGIEELAGMECPPEDWGAFATRIEYWQIDARREEDYEGLEAFIQTRSEGPTHRLYYLATAPGLFANIARNLGALGMGREQGAWRRILVEKPFGRDLGSAHALNTALHSAFDEHQVYRIDHYLGKETAQNVLYFRFLNTIFEPLWNRNYVSHVQITVAEDVDVGHRGAYYDQAGVLRDMFQNHLLQLLSLVAMEPPGAFEADAVRNEKVKVLKAIHPINPSATVRGQYEGYRQTNGVAADSSTATFAAVRLQIDNWRWQGVPFYLRSGKALAKKSSEIVIEFEPPPHIMFPLPEDYRLTPNFLSLCIQPDEGIHLRFETKVPDSPQETRSVDMDFHYRDSFGKQPLPDAYERLLLDALAGDASLFTRSDEIEAAWKVIDPLIAAWESDPRHPQLATYAPGTWGPVAADALLARDGFVWRLGCGHLPE